MSSSLILTLADASGIDAEAEGIASPATAAPPLLGKGVAAANAAGGDDDGRTELPALPEGEGGVKGGNDNGVVALPLLGKEEGEEAPFTGGAAAPPPKEG